MSLPRMTGNQPRTILPRTWNALIDKLGALERLANSLHVRSSSDILSRHSPSGTTLQLARRSAGGGGASSPLPLAASFTVALIGEGESEQDEIKMTVRGAYWQDDPEGEYTLIEPITEPEIGRFAYLKLTMDSGLNLIEQKVEIVILEEPPEAIFTLTTTGTPSFQYVSETYFLIAEVEGDEESGYSLRQRFNGNVFLPIRVYSGLLTRWPETVSGSLPPPPAPEEPVE